MAERILGLDIGTKRIGVAITDPLGIFARELCLVERKKDKEAQEKIKKLAKENSVTKIVAGIPYNTDGTLGFQAQNCIDFIKPLENEFKIVYCDESYTSFEAEELLKKENVKYTKNKGLVDLKSACLILEDYLRSGENK